jgi:hypothetical protein
LVQKKNKDHDSRKQFALEILSHIEEDETYLKKKKKCFSNEATFHVCGIINRHNCHRWGVKICMVLLNMSVIHYRKMCGAL